MILVPGHGNPSALIELRSFEHPQIRNVLGSEYWNRFTTLDTDSCSAGRVAPIDKAIPPSGLFTDFRSEEQNLSQEFPFIVIPGEIGNIDYPLQVVARAPTIHVRCVHNEPDCLWIWLSRRTWPSRALFRDSGATIAPTVRRGGWRVRRYQDDPKMPPFGA